MEGWVDLGYSVMHWPGVELAISQSQVRRPNHYTTKPPIIVTSVDHSVCWGYWHYCRLIVTHVRDVASIFGLECLSPEAYLLPFLLPFLPLLLLPSLSFFFSFRLLPFSFCVCVQHAKTFAKIFWVFYFKCNRSLTAGCIVCRAGE